MKDRISFNNMAILALFALLLGACAPAAPTTAPAAPTTAGKQFTIGYSNGGGVGNGFREEQVCTAKAQAKASGQVSDLTVIHRNTDAAGQLADIRTLIAKGVNAIVFNPNDPKALNPALAEASAAGIKTVAVDSYVTDPNTWNLYNNQVKYATLGADWLFKQLGGKGNVVEMRGINGVSADADRHQGFLATLANYPNIKVVKETFTNWSLDPAAQQIKDILGSGLKVDGIWTSGIDSTVVDQYVTAKKPFVPVIGADNNAFIGQLATLKSQGLSGAAVTNPATVGGAGLALGLDVLQGKTEPHLTNLDPIIWDNQSSTGLTELQNHYDPKLDAYYGVSYQVAPWTTYTKADLIACADV